MSNVYFIPVKSYSNIDAISDAGRKLLETVIEKEDVKLNSKIPLKVHFGEAGNVTFIEPNNFDGIIDYLEENEIESFFTDTNVLYRSPRTKRNTHMELAKEHGFTRLPVVIADGDHGEEYDEIEIDKKHFKTCKIGKEFSKYDQMIVLAHFKGHSMAGFGGAIKQLAMGCAARGGKLAQHSNSTPEIKQSVCTKCQTCVNNCPEDAITMEDYPVIDKDKCIGCAACIAVCPVGAVKVPWGGGAVEEFKERLAEYAYAAQKDKRNIYITFAFNLTSKCDCAGEKMKPIARDIGVFASTDPVALDQACMDLTDQLEKREVFEGRQAIEYGESIGLGSTDYELIEVEPGK